MNLFLTVLTTVILMFIAGLYLFTKTFPKFNKLNLGFLLMLLWAFLLLFLGTVIYQRLI